MSDWFISSHGMQPANLFQRCKIPGKMKVYLYVQEGEQLTMDAGWNLWDMLMYGARGGVNAVKRNARYVKDRTQDMYDYEFGIGVGETWDDTVVGHHAIDAVGIFEVGDYSPPAGAPAPVGPAIPTFPQTVRLSEILKAAAAANVWAVHVGACRERGAGGKLMAPRWLL